jgi:hypothetical protein
LDFLVVEAAPRHPCKRQTQQAKSFERRRGLTFRLERRTGGQDEKEPVQPELFACGLRDQEMPEVNRVKGPTE